MVVVDGLGPDDLRVSERFQDPIQPIAARQDVIGVDEQDELVACRLSPDGLAGLPCKKRVEQHLRAVPIGDFCRLIRRMRVHDDERDEIGWIILAK